VFDSGAFYRAAEHVGRIFDRALPASSSIVGCLVVVTSFLCLGLGTFFKRRKEWMPSNAKAIGRDGALCAFSVGWAKRFGLLGLKLQR
ncbi:MAG: hypothetical protein AAGA58_18400, partial [Verrucomicrobiota bacterium]